MTQAAWLLAGALFLAVGWLTTVHKWSFATPRHAERGDPGAKVERSGVPLALALVSAAFLVAGVYWNLVLLLAPAAGFAALAWLLHCMDCSHKQLSPWWPG